MDYTGHVKCLKCGKFHWIGYFCQADLYDQTSPTFTGTFTTPEAHKALEDGKEILKQLREKNDRLQQEVDELKSEIGQIFRLIGIPERDFGALEDYVNSRSKEC